VILGGNGIQDYSNEGEHLSTRGDNSEKVKKKFNI
jgi:hypothetical protein